MKVEKLLPSAASSSVFLGYLPANTPFVILEQHMSLPRKGYKELKILSTNGEIGWVFGYPSQFEELTDG